MTYAEIKNINSKIRKYIREGRLRDAFRLMINTTEASMLWEVGDVVKRIERNYAYMLKYLTDGAADPGRDAMHAEIVDATYNVLDELTFRLLKKEHSTLYYNNVRYMANAGRSLESLLQERLSMMKQDNVKGVEQAEADIFNKIWAAMPLPKSDAELLVFNVLDPTESHRFHVLIVNGLILGLLEFFDATRLNALIEIYQTGSTVYAETQEQRYQATEITSMAMIGILLALYKYRERPLPENIRKRLKKLDESTTWHSDLKIAFTELLRTRDTERINRTISEEIIPTMMKMRPTIEKEIKMGMIDPENLEANPEWEKMMEKSGVADRLREISELQQEGADVFMSTFTHLKNFPFFNSISNWFIPFDTTRTEVAQANLTPNILEMVDKMPFLVAGDKYSFVFSWNMISGTNKDMAVSQLELQGREMMEQLSRQFESSTPDDLRVRTIRAYVGTLYRFYNLFRRKGEFYNPFADGVNLLRVPELAHDLDDPELLRVIAEFFFQKKFWLDAADAFMRLDDIAGPDGQMYQKLGYALRRAGNIDKALDYFLQAEMLTPDSTWLTQMIAATYRDKDDLMNAARYYQRLTDIEPENADYAMQYGYVLLRQNLLEQALKQFFKAEFLEQDSPRTVRPLAWTLFLAGRYEDSRRYYDRLENLEPTATDWLNIGHLALAQQRYSDAVNAYSKSLSMHDNNEEKFLAEMNTDLDALHAAGVTDDILHMITDAILYKRDNKV